jgi:hypothetical protein
MTAKFGGLCDRCGTTFLIGLFPNACLCPGCYLGGMPPADAHQLIGHVKRIGVRAS